MKVLMKTEKEKCHSGELYDANYDAELIQERQVCKERCHAYNQLAPSALKEREAIIRDLLGNSRFIAIMVITSKSERIFMPT